MKERITVFLSHSHKDVEKVRQIRDVMELAEFEPLIFYLACLTNDDEIKDLIEREIKARKVFVYCESDNSRKSHWVKQELDIIQSFDKTRYYQVDIEKDVSEGMAEIFKKLSTVYKDNNITYLNNVKKELTGGFVSRIAPNYSKQSKGSGSIEPKLNIMFNFLVPLSTSGKYGYAINVINNANLPKKNEIKKELTRIKDNSILLLQLDLYANEQKAEKKEKEMIEWLDENRDAENVFVVYDSETDKSYEDKISMLQNKGIEVYRIQEDNEKLYEAIYEYSSKNADNMRIEDDLEKVHPDDEEFH